MKKILLSSVVLVLMAAGCNSSQQASVQTPVAQSPAPSPETPNPTPAPATSPASPTPATPAAPAPATPPVQALLVLKLASSSTLGEYLTGTNGMTLYTYGKDTANASNCTGACATNWPPYTVSSAAQLAASAGVSGKLGTITRADGKVQLTYKNMPLYFWVNDAKAGDVTGDGINSFAVAKP